MASMPNSLFWEGLKCGNAWTISTIFKITRTQYNNTTTYLGLYERAWVLPKSTNEDETPFSQGNNVRDRRTLDMDPILSFDR